MTKSESDTRLSCVQHKLTAYRRKRKRSSIVSDTRAPRTTPEERRLVLSGHQSRDELVRFDEHAVWCKCGEKIELAKHRQYDLEKWKRHREKCKFATGVNSRSKGPVKQKVVKVSISAVVRRSVYADLDGTVSFPR
jgi:hypothetical protein